ncbi:VOC family protein [Salinibacterium hongtaonis]|uniref:VOC family protein n=1 Tax=Homoserinimonas hongtaonis TaxID=2079791 RepID=A0A2U1T2Y3_9MICO|nr:VOC family protein [Salinibacterium hongtaonis]AWB88464.1 hypothetical protein C2138_01900 [Salinibacterium hongtaonis]PWB98244.1 VOC family protein [Salinibacterium hongtaonis]
MSTLNPYLGFRDSAREAMIFYQSVFGGELKFNTFGEFQASQDPAEADKIMHSQLEAPNGFVLMASDTPDSMEAPTESNIMLSVSGTDEREIRGYFDRLLEGGRVIQPLEAAPWGDVFGMLTDRYGTRWLMNIG